MEGPITKAMIDVGIIDPDALKQLRVWGLMSQPVEPAGTFDSADAAAQHIIEAVESREAVAIRDTDFEVLKQYLATKVKGKLHVPNPEDPDKTVGISVYYGKTKMGEIVMPYLEETIMDSVQDDVAYLKPVGGERLYFTSVRTLYYDDHPAFVICEVSEEMK